MLFGTAVFDYVVRELNRAAGADEFQVTQDNRGFAIVHLPTNVVINVFPWLPLNPEKPFAVLVRLRYRFTFFRDGRLNAPLIVKRVREVRELERPPLRKP